MKLLTDSILKRFQEIGRQTYGPKSDPLIVCKFFFPIGKWTWYATEYNEERGIFFGYVVGEYEEWGKFSLSQLKQFNVSGLEVERDILFEPCKFSELELT